jgi:hypothetical protein
MAEIIADVPPQQIAARHVTEDLIRYLQARLDRLKYVNVHGATPDTLGYLAGEKDELTAWLKAAQTRRERQP